MQVIIEAFAGQRRNLVSIKDDTASVMMRFAGRSPREFDFIVAKFEPSGLVAVCDNVVAPLWITRERDPFPARNEMTVDQRIERDLAELKTRLERCERFAESPRDFQAVHDLRMGIVSHELALREARCQHLEEEVTEFSDLNRRFACVYCMKTLRVEKWPMSSTL